MPFGQHSESHNHSTGGKRASDTERSEAWVISFLFYDTKKVEPGLSVSLSVESGAWVISFPFYDAEQSGAWVISFLFYDLEGNIPR